MNMISNSKKHADTNSDLVAIALSKLDKKWSSVEPMRTDLGPPELRDKVYRWLLKTWEMHPKHLSDIKRRGLSPNEYKSIPNNKNLFALYRKFGVAIYRVPGIAFVSGGPMLTGSSGLAIPVYDYSGRIVAIKIKRYKSFGPKYISLSSASYGGPSPGAVLHFPLGTPPKPSVLRITEGELKADYAFKVTKIPTISIPGVSCWRLAVRETLRVMPRRVLIALDADYTTNPNVKGSLRDLIGILDRLNLTIEIECWSSEYKGIDDALLAGTKIKRVPGKQFLRELGQMTPDDITTWEVENGSRILQDPPEEPKLLIAGVARIGSKITLCAPSKARKTFIQMHTALCIASGRPWFGRQTTQGRVLYVNLELSKWSFAKRLKDIAQKMRISKKAVNLDILHLRGKMATVEALWKFCSENIRPGRYSLIIIDPLYKILGKRNENDANSMADLFMRLESIASQAGASLLVAHHFAKGNSATKESMDRASGSGVIARDGDAIITLTPHSTDECYTIEFTLRDFAPAPSAVLRWKHPLFEVDLNLHPDDLKRANRGIAALDICLNLTTLATQFRILCRESICADLFR